MLQSKTIATLSSETDILRHDYSPIGDFTAQLSSIVDGKNEDTASILGIQHRVIDGKPFTLVRTLRPDIQALSLTHETLSEPVTLEHLHRGIWGCCLPGHLNLSGYKLSINNTQWAHDPYEFLGSIKDNFWTSDDIHLFGEGKNCQIYEKMGAHQTILNGINGTMFSVWAPTAKGVSLIGDMNNWDGRLARMQALGNGIWAIFIPDAELNQHYKFEINAQNGSIVKKADPYAQYSQIPADSASITTQINTYKWNDETWLAKRLSFKHHESPVSVYEVHLGSWRKTLANQSLSYRDLGKQLADYCKQMNFTHVELMPVMEHPFDGSWGYQVTGYYAPTSRHGTPTDFMALVDTLHEAGIGVILDWVPGHFPKDGHGLGKFDGSPLYEHADPRQGEHAHWGTLIPNFGRNEVRNFFVANALYWIDKFHIDGLRVDAVASMLYLDYGKEGNGWVPNKFGGNENLEAMAFFRELNTVIHQLHPGVMTIAEESTAFPKITQMVHNGGLGFDMKWDMGWMNDTLRYFSKDELHRRYYPEELLKRSLWAFSENFMLPLSHDEVVHGKKSILEKMSGDYWQKFANTRLLYALQWLQPGKKLSFMGNEFGQYREWSELRSLDWHLTQLQTTRQSPHTGLQHLVSDLNALYRRASSLFLTDNEPASFSWLKNNDPFQGVYAFSRIAPDNKATVIVFNTTPEPRLNYRLGLPFSENLFEQVNTDAQVYGGSGIGNMGKVIVEPIGYEGQKHSAKINVPPLGAVILSN